jgi:predicted RNA-binding Zn ribbon-like protein
MKARSIETLRLDGGCLCLDFINTVHSRMEEPSYEYLHDYYDIIQWALYAGALSGRQHKALRAYSGAHRDKALAVFKTIKNVREELYHIFFPLTEGKIPSRDIMKKFNDYLEVVLPNMKMTFQKNEAIMQWKNGDNPLSLPLWIVIKSACDLLLTEPFERIKSCPACGWLFLDKTKNNKRRWCNSLTCGSIDKARRYYYRKKDKKN